ncbi:hypothetical protein [Hymenobacter arizonensis]|uniref:Tetratricopeptide repeat-containing protein n=1 Tax=Hymenobacter arizonensis TaxID=1227077 RepID=A0A1I5UF05_HYMAR|nr:hypothetical protein [Hymenobacter arizonensis]SFP93617.1 hypothetical protein SAMN04515668_0886 [Hymenobacter arizonensis]
MTRATLLHVLDHTSAIGPAEVRELEQLAQAFPYCQTAHLLLAKAAHDQGTMLAGQRLRRAATYAADRTLLRRLIEHVEPATAPEEPFIEQAPVEVVPAVLATPSPLLLVDTEMEVPVAAAAPIPQEGSSETTTVHSEPEPESAVSLPIVEVIPATPLPIEEAAPVQEQAPASPPVLDETAPPAPLIQEPQAEEPPVEESLVEELPTQEPPVDEPLIEELPIVEPPIEQPQAELAPSPSETDVALLLEVEGIDIPAIEGESNVFPEDQEVIELEPEAEEDLLPAQAPAVRPPVEVGEARFEFGLAEPPPPAVPTYELPGLVDEWAASAVTRSLGSLDPLPEVSALYGTSSATDPVFTPAAFTGDDAIGYAFGESSRLGFSMQLLDLLTNKAEAADAAATQAAVAQPPATPLPPAGAFFEPDPLLLNHWATHCPPPPAVPSSLDLINNFLRRQPRLTRPAMLPPPSGVQADLSMRSTRAESDLASESLARIFVRQGKTARAIEIYEKLMVKQPEKMAYFAAQIQSLQPPA